MNCQYRTLYYTSDLQEKLAVDSDAESAAIFFEFTMLQTWLFKNQIKWAADVMAVLPQTTAPRTKDSGRNSQKSARYRIYNVK